MRLDLYQDGKHYFYAKQINHGQSDIWLGDDGKELTPKRRLATNEGSIHDPSTTSWEGAANCEPSSKAGNWLRELMARNLFLHGLD
jgi:hypothetical protein